jgi:hypothetical protein
MKKYINQIIIVVAIVLLLISYKLGVFGYVLAFYLGFGVCVLISFLGSYLDGKQKFKEIDDELLRIYKSEQENG